MPFVKDNVQKHLCLFLDVKINFLEHIQKIKKPNKGINVLSFIKDADREKVHSNKTKAFLESMNMDIWVDGTSNQLFVRGSRTKTK